MKLARVAGEEMVRNGNFPIKPPEAPFLTVPIHRKTNQYLRGSSIVFTSVAHLQDPQVPVKEELEASKHEGRPTTKDELRKSAITWTGHEESLKMAAALMEEFQLPGGLLPLQEVVELGFERATGYFWIVQKKRIEHHFKVIGKLVAYAPDISGFLEKHRIKKVSGVKGKEFLLWVPVGDISLDPTTGKIHFKSLAGITKTFPVEAFAAGQ